MSNWAIFLFVLALLSSCEKAVKFNLDETDPKLVVEASIENNQSPIVILSKSLGYFSAISPEILQNSFVRQAEVYMSNGILTHRLKEDSVDLGAGYFFYFYSIDSSNLATAFVGELDHTYSLRIVAEGNEYLATTTIPKITKQIDSFFWRPAPSNAGANKVVAIVKATDPPGFGDYIRYFTRRNAEPFYPGINSVFDDQVIDGTSYEIQVERGWNRNVPPDDRSPYFLKGDTITLKLSNIDKASFDFWRTMEFSYASVGNPFSTPVKVLSNISGNALGYFGGYAAQFRTIIVPN